MRALRAGMSALSTICPPAAARLAHHLWYRPQRLKLAAREFGVLTEAKCRPHTVGAHTLSVYEWGVGPTVLLVHGWSGRTAQFSEFVPSLTRAGLRVIGFDAPAHGRSSGNATSLPEISATIRALSDVYGPLHAIVAHSFGVACTLHALHQGLRVKRVVGISPPATIEHLFRVFSERLGLRAAAQAGARRLFEARFGADVWTAFAPIELAPRVAAPALIVHDRGDREVPWRDGAALAEAWPGAVFKLTDGLGHRRLLSDPDVIEAALTFLQNR
ncbi:MAG: alpha/beta fold hydrolase [Gammaproteobacteria bacterium]